MMKKGLLLGFAAVTIAGITIFQSSNDTNQYTPRSADADEISPRGIAGAYEYYAQIKRNVDTGLPPTAEDVLKMRKAVRSNANTQSKAVGLQWSEMGPDNVGGRTRAITINPNNPNEIWCGGISGGLWKSDNQANNWYEVTSFGQGLNGNMADDNFAVASICFAGNGDILVGTGSTWDRGFGGGGSGSLGGGVFHSNDGGASWNRILGPNVSFNLNQPYTEVDEIWPYEADPNKVWIGSSEGLELYDLVSGTSTSPALCSGQNIVGIVQAMDMSADGQTIGAVISNSIYLSTNGGSCFDLINANFNGVATGIQGGRKEIAVARENGNYIYVLHANGAGAMAGVYGSSDRGQTWSSLWPNPVPDALDIFGDNTQGAYDNVIETVAGDPTSFWVGGVSLWKGSITGQPLQIAQTAAFPGCFNCVHADVHEITWDYVNNIAYVGSDGGVNQGFLNNGNEVFVAANRGLNITQFYGIGYDPQGKVLGGTQDNSTPYLDLQNSLSIQEADVLFGGDGFDAEASQLDPGVLFATSQFGSLGRSADGGLNFGSFYSQDILDLEDAEGNLADFFTNIRYWETYNDPNSPNTTIYLNIGQDTIEPGDFVEYRGRNTSIPLYTTATQQYLPGDTIFNLPDPVQSLFATGITGGTSLQSQNIWVTRDALAVNSAAQWWRVSNNVGTVHALEWSADGNNLFIGTDAGQVYLITGFANVYDTAGADITNRPVNGALIDTSAWLINVNTGDTIMQGQSNLDYANEDFTTIDGTPITYKLSVRLITSNAGPCTGLASDPQDPNHLVITYGGYGGSGKVRESNNALSLTPTFNNIWNPGAGLQGMPCYDAIIHRDNPDIIVVGTEWGVYSTDDGGATWAMENDGAAFVPVFEVRQQIMDFQSPHWAAPGFIENPGVIYIGTHGRGIFRSETLLGLEDNAVEPAKVINDLTVFPNPSVNVTNFRLNIAHISEVNAVVYDLNGRLVKNVASGRMGVGTQNMQFDVTDLANGTYLLRVEAGSDVKVGRFIVQH